MSALIKAGSPHTAATGFSRLSLRDIGRDAEACLADARARGEEMVADAVSRAERERVAIREQAKAEGLRAGMAEGRAAGHAEALAEARDGFASAQKSLVAAMTDAVGQLVDKRALFLAQARQDVVLLAVAIARRLSGMEPLVSQMAPKAAAEALACVRAATDIVIRIHPDDAAALDSLVEAQAKQLRDGVHARVVADTNMSRGDVVVETADTVVDASIASRIDQIASGLAPHWRERSRELSLEA